MRTAADEARRRELLDRAWAPDAVHCDPLALVVGREALVAHTGEFPQSMPGARVDVVQLDADGRITRLTGFFDGPG